MKQLWQMWEAGISSDIVNSIILEAETYPVAPIGLGFSGETSNEQYRSSTIKWVNPDNSADITRQLWYYVNEANKNAFNFDISYLRDIQYTIYQSATNDKYDWHQDTFWANPSMFDRKLSVVIQLSDSDTYTGGNFEFDSQYESPNPVALRQKGTVLIFPSFLTHRVTPLLSGTRKSLVAWVEGPAFR